MRYSGFDEFRGAAAGHFLPGPAALILAEDQTETDSTIRHHLAIGFNPVILFADDAILVDPALESQILRVRHDVHQEDALTGIVNRVLRMAPAGTWLYYCYNAEYLMFPFCETRSVREMLAFHTEERRSAMLTCVIDLYADDLGRFPDAVSLQQARLDRVGYYALGRADPAKPGALLERQLDFFGGLRWRFEEHVARSRRKIDRISLMRAKPGLSLRGNYTLSDEEYNTYACPWHHNLTACICSFRTAKALKSNPGSRYQIGSFLWHGSTEFLWHSQQLMDMGLMEPGQWF